MHDQTWFTNMWEITEHDPIKGIIKFGNGGYQGTVLYVKTQLQSKTKNKKKLQIKNKMKTTRVCKNEFNTNNTNNTKIKK